MSTKKVLILPEQFKFLTDTESGRSVTCMVYGPAKTGKTWFMGTAGDRTLIIDNGAGIETLRSPLFKEKIKANPLTITIPEDLDSMQFPDKAEAFDYIIGSIDHALKNFPDKFDTICIDDSTSLRRAALFKGLELNQSSGKSKTLEGAKNSEVFSPAVQDYGIEMQIIMQFFIQLISTCKTAGKHLFVGAHERHTFKKGDKIGDAPTVIRIRPGFTGQTMPDDIGGLWDCLFHSEIVSSASTDAYRMRTSGDDILMAGTRYGGVFETVEINLTIKSMLERIQTSKLNAKARGMR